MPNGVATPHKDPETEQTFTFASAGTRTRVITARVRLQLTLGKQLASNRLVAYPVEMSFQVYRALLFGRAVNRNRRASD